MASAAEELVQLRDDEATLVREGDLILLAGDDLLGRFLGFFNRGWSHVVTAVAHEDRLVGFSVYMPPDGLVMEPLERFGSSRYTHVAVVRPDPPRTAEQTLRLRRMVASVLRQHNDNPRDAYDPGLAECFHALFRLPPATNDRYICTELAALLAQAAGAWPEGKSCSVTITDLAQSVGKTEAVF